MITVILNDSFSHTLQWLQSIFIIFIQHASAIRWELWATGVTKHPVSVCVEKEWQASGVTAALRDTNRASPLCGPAYVSLPPMEHESKGPDKTETSHENVNFSQHVTGLHVG